MRWSGHVERIVEYRIARRVLMAKVTAGRVRGRPRWGWTDGVKVALGNRGTTVEAARQCEWRVESPGTYVTDRVSRGHFFWPCVLSDRTPVLWWLSPGDEWDAVTWCGWDKLQRGRNCWKSRGRCQIYGLRGVRWWLCECHLTWWKPWYIIINYYLR